MTAPPPPGTPVQWTDSRGVEHTGVVTAFPDTPTAMADFVHVIETVTSEVPHWLAPLRLREIPLQAASVDPGVVCDGGEGG